MRNLSWGPSPQNDKLRWALRSMHPLASPLVPAACLAVGIHDCRLSRGGCVSQHPNLHIINALFIINSPGKAFLKTGDPHRHPQISVFSFLSISSDNVEEEVLHGRQSWWSRRWWPPRRTTPSQSVAAMSRSATRTRRRTRAAFRAPMPRTETAANERPLAWGRWRPHYLACRWRRRSGMAHARRGGWLTAILGMQ
jgi:hypothetical protein